HFAEVMTWRLRSGARDRWREVIVRWPPPSPSLGTRLATLLDELASTLAVKLNAPTVDPTTSEGARAWAPALASIVAAIDASRECLLIRHVVRYLEIRGGGDSALVDAYVHAVWSSVAKRPGERVAVCLNLRRVERVGIPMTRAWRNARTEIRAT